jgi:hypothetical protein
VRGVAFVVVAGSVVGLALVAGPGRASLYSPEAPFAIPFEDGKPSQLPFDEFKRRRAVLRNAVIEPKAGEPVNPDRKEFLDRIEKRMPKGTDAEKERALKKLPTTEAVALAVDLLHVGQTDRALNLLIPRSRRPDYLVFSTLAHVHATRGEWADALRYHTEARLDTEMPAELKGLSKSQRDWWDKLDADYVTWLYRIRAGEIPSAPLTAQEREKREIAEEILPIFPFPQPNPAGKPVPPVRFVNDAGEYQPGVLAAAEKAKLPPDAVAVVQQLILWFPLDTRLYWLLAELYAAENDLDSAIAILDECAWGLGYGNRQLLMDHRNAVRAAIDARPKPETPKSPISMRDILLYFAVVGGVAALAFGRVIYRRLRAGRA